MPWLLIVLQCHVSFLTLIFVPQDEETLKLKLCKSGCGFSNHRSELEISPFLRSLNRTSEVSVKTFGTLFHLNFLSPRCFRCHSLLAEWAYFIEFGLHMTVVKCRVCLFLRLCVCQPRRPKWRQPSRFAVQTRTILVEMLHKCFSQFREIALPSSGPEDWMASKSDCNCEGMLVHHFILLPSVKLTEPGVSPYFARKSWMYQLECYFFFFFFDWISTLWYSLWPLNLVSQLYFRDQLCNQQVKMHRNGKP